MKKSEEILVTQKMLFQVKEELKHDLTNVHLEVKSLEKKMDARFNQVDARFNQVDSRFNQVDANIHKVLAEVQRIGLLVEDQNARNKYVLDGHQNLYDRQNCFEKEMKNEINDIKRIVSVSKTSNKN